MSRLEYLLAGTLLGIARFFFSRLKVRRNRVVLATARVSTLDGNLLHIHRAMVERHLSLARQLAERVDAEPQLERLTDVKLNIVCFRARPKGMGEEHLDQLNRDLGEALLRDGRVFAGTTTYESKVAFRPAIVNWRTRESDVDALVDVLLELLDQVADNRHR